MSSTLSLTAVMKLPDNNEQRRGSVYSAYNSRSSIIEGMSEKQEPETADYIISIVKSRERLMHPSLTACSFYTQPALFTFTQFRV